MSLRSSCPQSSPSGRSGHTAAACAAREGHAQARVRHVQERAGVACLGTRAHVAGPLAAGHLALAPLARDGGRRALAAHVGVQLAERALHKSASARQLLRWLWRRRFWRRPNLVAAGRAAHGPQLALGLVLGALALADGRLHRRCRRRCGRCRRAHLAERAANGLEAARDGVPRGVRVLARPVTAALSRHGAVHGDAPLVPTVSAARRCGAVQCGAPAF
jgi:hypothetical protein